MTQVARKFYPLRNQEWLRACQELKPAEKDILFYLRTLDPFGDKELELGVSTIASELGRNKGTVSRALKALNSKGWIKLELIRVKVKINSLATQLPPHNSVVSAQPSCLHTTQLSLHNSVVVTQPQLSLHNHSCLHTTTVVPPQPTSSETKTEQELENSKTLKTIKTFQTEKEEGEKTFSLAKNEQENQVALLQVGSQNSEVGSGATPLGKPQQGNADQERGGTPRREPQQGNADQESQNRESEVGNTEGSGGKCATQEVQNKEEISQELINKLENLKIPLDKAVRKAIADHDLSQVYGALAHIENTWESVKIPRSVFLYQLSKQAVKKAPERFSQEFFDWYSQAIASGIVEDLPPRYLSTNCYNEPLVRLKRPDPCTGAPYTLVEWRRVQLEPDYDPNPKMAFSAIQKCLEQLKQKSRKSK